METKKKIYFNDGKSVLILFSKLYKNSGGGM